MVVRRDRILRLVIGMSRVRVPVRSLLRVAQLAERLVSEFAYFSPSLPSRKAHIMSRFNAPVRTGVQSPISTILTETPVRTAQGGKGYLRDTRSELFVLAVSNMVSEKDDFYESAKAKDSRFVALLHSPEVFRDREWATGFVRFLRSKANLRSASIVAAAEIVHARLAAAQAALVGPIQSAKQRQELQAPFTGNRHIVSAAISRADEPGEFLAYWQSKYGKNFPQPVKRGISDAIDRLWNERAYLKWDSESKGFRFADILQLVHPKTEKEWQNRLFKFTLNTRYSTEPVLPEGLDTITARINLMALPVAERKNVTAGQLAEAGMTWEALAGWQQAPMDAASWEKIIPSMGVFALLRNLRNFDQAGINKAARRLVEDQLTDPEQITRSQILPMRYMSAYRATQSSGTVSGWAPVIEQGLNLSLANIPELSGRTLILVDLSGSMGAALSARSDLRRKDAAAIFGAAVAKRCEFADLYGFDGRLYKFDFTTVSSILPLANTITASGGGSTATGDAIAASYKGHDRLLIITDEQVGGSGGWYGHGRVPVDQALSGIKVPVYTWNLGGARVAQMEQGKLKRHAFGGLNDASFKMVPLLEAGQSQDWAKLFNE
jgi:hypothetical protein